MNENLVMCLWDQVRKAALIVASKASRVPEDEWAMIDYSHEMKRMRRTDVDSSLPILLASFQGLQSACSISSPPRH